MRRPEWSLPLDRPIVVKNGPVLRTLKEAANYVTKQPADTAWSRAAELLMRAAETGQVGDACRHIESVLWHRGGWVIPSIPTMENGRGRRQEQARSRRPQSHQSE
jgi:hypothetical protein